MQILIVALMEEPPNIQNIAAQPTETGDWGPILSPSGYGANITWFTIEKQVTQICIGNRLYYGRNIASQTKTGVCGEQIFEKPTNFHQIHIDSRVFTATVLNRSIVFNNTPKDVVKFIITTDAHGNTSCIRRSIGRKLFKFDFHISAGDNTMHCLPREFQKVYKYWHQRPYIEVQGNHDAYEVWRHRDEIEVRPMNFHQEVKGVHVFGIFVFNTSDTTRCTKLSQQYIDQSIDYLEQNIDLFEGYKVIVNHYPLYSTGWFGSHQYFAKRFEEFLDRHQNSKIILYISGHDHVFAAFNRSNLLILVAGSGGGRLNDVFWSKRMGTKRVWASEELHGPLVGMGKKSIGYQYHLDSYQLFTRTEVTISNGSIRFDVRNLRDMKILVSYVRDERGVLGRVAMGNADNIMSGD